MPSINKKGCLKRNRSSGLPPNCKPADQCKVHNHSGTHCSASHLFSGTQRSQENSLSGRQRIPLSPWRIPASGASSTSLNTDRLHCRFNSRRACFCSSENKWSPKISVSNTLCSDTTFEQSILQLSLTETAQLGTNRTLWIEQCLHPSITIPSNTPVFATSHR